MQHHNSNRSEGEVLADVFTIPNNLDGFRFLLRRIRDCTHAQDKIKVGLEATGHYSYNLLGFLLDNGLPTYVLNPLRTNLYRKSLSLRKTKTDRVDARTIAAMLLSDAGLKPYTNTAYHNEELRSLTRYRFDKVKERAKLKSSIARLVCILFPELEKLVPSLHIASVYALLEEFPGRLSCQETRRGQTLQCRTFSCRQKASTPHICYGEIQAAILLSILTATT